jgi:hypothetical protein
MRLAGGTSLPTVTGRPERARGRDEERDRAAEVEPDHPHAVGLHLPLGEPAERGVGVGDHLVAVEPPDLLLGVLLVDLVGAVAVVEVRGDGRATRRPRSSARDPAPNR